MLKSFLAAVVIAAAMLPGGSVGSTPEVDKIPDPTETTVVCPDGSPTWAAGKEDFLKQVEELGGKLAMEKDFGDGTFGILIDNRDVAGVGPENAFLGLLFYTDTGCWTGVIMYFTEQQAQDMWGLVLATQ